MWLGDRGTLIGFEVCCQVCALTSFTDKLRAGLSNAHRPEGKAYGMLPSSFSDFVPY